MLVGVGSIKHLGLFAAFAVFFADGRAAARSSIYDYVEHADTVQVGGESFGSRAEISFTARPS